MVRFWSIILPVIPLELGLCLNDPIRKLFPGRKSRTKKSSHCQSSKSFSLYFVSTTLAKVCERGEAGEKFFHNKFVVGLKHVFAPYIQAFPCSSNVSLGVGNIIS